MGYVEIVPKNKEEEVMVVWRRWRRKHEIISKHIKKFYETLSKLPAKQTQEGRHLA